MKRPSSLKKDTFNYMRIKQTESANTDLKKNEEGGRKNGALLNMSSLIAEHKLD
ncbi:hypothetical protein J8J04_00380 ['Fragaria x ananassa' phyllody phytoplasma]|uniref:Uncharacterized protein n=1 Tax='Fragaria x ananassa' phyllody phytoplasma TaxID=2358428 RepID=A0ABS5K341_9MOLU|nr:hypothetical protein ['Fragaria x ananassa' phyllody phytoplasma]MBS2126179.1 hypothetical protein ['Fragaria x ananassa' phyllody phytoplasma]